MRGETRPNVNREKITGNSPELNTVWPGEGGTWGTRIEGRRFGEVFLALGILGVRCVLGIDVCSRNPNATKRVKVPRRKEQETS